MNKYVHCGRGRPRFPLHFFLKKLTWKQIITPNHPPKKTQDFKGRFFFRANRWIWFTFGGKKPSMFHWHEQRFGPWKIPNFFISNFWKIWALKKFGPWNILLSCLVLARHPTGKNPKARRPRSSSSSRRRNRGLRAHERSPRPEVVLGAKDVCWSNLMQLGYPGLPFIGVGSTKQKHQHLLVFCWLKVFFSKKAVSLVHKTVHETTHLHSVFDWANRYPFGKSIWISRFAVLLTLHATCCFQILVLRLPHI